MCLCNYNFLEIILLLDFNITMKSLFILNLVDTSCFACFILKNLLHKTDSKKKAINLKNE